MQQTGYHSTNVVIHTDYDATTAEAFANLISASQADRFFIAQLTAANHSHTNQLAASNEKINAAFTDITAFKREIEQLKASNPRNRLRTAFCTH